MHSRTPSTTARTRARSLTLAALVAVAVSGTLVTGAHAEPNGGPVSANTPCYIPGSNLPYVAGEKATFSLNGQPAAEHTCQKDGTWTAIQSPYPRTWVVWGGGGFLAP
jgi:hypothetical protein